MVDLRLRPFVAALAMVIAAAPLRARSEAAPAAGHDAVRGPAPVPYLLDDDRAVERRHMVEAYLAPHIHDAAVLDAMRRVPRHRFIPAAYSRSAYYNRPLPIGDGQTISQPYIVALMTELLELGPESRVLEIGTGSGYQAAILAELAGEVWSIELLEPLGRQAADLLTLLGYDRIHLRIGDGFRGWPEAAPFDAIIVTCAPESIPAPLLEQLDEGGRLVIPVGQRLRDQKLLQVRKTDGELVTREVIPVRFVPMVDGKGDVHGG